MASKTRQTTYEGWVEKKPATKRGRWKKRYLTVDGSLLSIFASQEEADKTGGVARTVLPLAHLVIDPHAHSRFPKKIEAKDAARTFALLPTGESSESPRLFRAANAADAQKWAEALGFAWPSDELGLGLAQDDVYGLRLTLAAYGLPKMDSGFRAKSDPYIEIMPGARAQTGIPASPAELVARTEVHLQTLSCQFAPLELAKAAIGSSGMVTLAVFDWDDEPPMDFIGQAVVELDSLARVGAHFALSRDGVLLPKASLKVVAAELISSPLPPPLSQPPVALVLDLTGEKLANRDGIGASRTLIFTSEVVPNSSSPHFAPAIWTDRKVVVSVYDADDDGSVDLIGSTTTSLGQLAFPTRLSLRLNPRSKPDGFLVVRGAQRVSDLGQLPSPPPIAAQWALGMGAPPAAVSFGLTARLKTKRTVFFQLSINDPGLALPTFFRSPQESGKEVTFGGARVWLPPGISPTTSLLLDVYEAKANGCHKLLGVVAVTVAQLESPHASLRLLSPGTGKFYGALSVMGLDWEQLPQRASAVDEADGAGPSGGASAPLAYRLAVRGAKLARMDGPMGKSDPFFEVIKLSPELARRKGPSDLHSGSAASGGIILYRSETVAKSLSPQWRPFVLNMADVGELTTPLEIVVFDSDKDGTHDSLGAYRTTLSELLLSVPFEYPLHDANVEPAYGVVAYPTAKSRGAFVVDAIQPCEPATAANDISGVRVLWALGRRDPASGSPGLLLYVSEPAGPKTKAPQWAPFVLPAAAVGGADAEFEIRIYDRGVKAAPHTPLGALRCTLSDWLKGSFLRPIKLPCHGADESSGSWAVASMETLLTPGELADVGDVAVAGEQWANAVPAGSDLVLDLKLRDLARVGSNSNADPFLEIAVGSATVARTPPVTGVRSAHFPGLVVPGAALEAAPAADIVVRVWDFEPDGKHNLMGTVALSRTQIVQSWTEVPIKAAGDDASLGKLVVVSASGAAAENRTGAESQMATLVPTLLIAGPRRGVADMAVVYEVIDTCRAPVTLFVSEPVSVGPVAQRAFKSDPKHEAVLPRVQLDTRAIRKGKPVTLAIRLRGILGGGGGVVDLGSLHGTMADWALGPSRWPVVESEAGWSVTLAMTTVPEDESAPIGSANWVLPTTGMVRIAVSVLSSGDVGEDALVFLNVANRAGQLLARSTPVCAGSEPALIWLGASTRNSERVRVSIRSASSPASGSFPAVHSEDWAVALCELVDPSARRAARYHLIAPGVGVAARVVDTATNESVDASARGGVAAQLAAVAGDAAAAGRPVAIKVGWAQAHASAGPGSRIWFTAMVDDVLAAHSWPVTVDATGRGVWESAEMLLAPVAVDDETSVSVQVWEEAELVGCGRTTLGELAMAPWATVALITGALWANASSTLCFAGADTAGAVSLALVVASEASVQATHRELLDAVRLGIRVSRLSLGKRGRAFLEVSARRSLVYRSEVVEVRRGGCDFAPLTLRAPASHCELEVAIWRFEPSGAHETVAKVQTTVREVREIGTAPMCFVAAGVVLEVVEVSPADVSEAVSRPVAVTLTPSAYKLANLDGMRGKSDPFFTIKCGPNLVHRSRVVKNNLSPSWAPFVVDLGEVSGRDLQVVVYDADGDGDHDEIGGWLVSEASLCAGSWVSGSLTCSDRRGPQGRMQFEVSKYDSVAAAEAAAAESGGGVAVPAESLGIEVEIGGNKLNTSGTFVVIENASGLVVARSEVVSKTKGASYGTFRIEAEALGGSVADGMLNVAMYSADKRGDHELLGRVGASVRELQYAPLTKAIKVYDRNESAGAMVFVAMRPVLEPRDEGGASGGLSVVRLSCVSLDNLDSALGKSDPFAEVWAGDELLHVTPVVMNQLSPKWPPFALESVPPTLKVVVYDFDNDGKHDKIGEAEVKVTDVCAGPWYLTALRRAQVQAGSTGGLCVSIEHNAGAGCPEPKIRASDVLVRAASGEAIGIALTLAAYKPSSSSSACDGVGVWRAIADGKCVATSTSDVLVVPVASLKRSLTFTLERAVVSRLAGLKKLGIGTVSMPHALLERCRVTMSGGWARSVDVWTDGSVGVTEVELPALQDPLAPRADAVTLSVVFEAQEPSEVDRFWMEVRSETCGVVWWTNAAASGEAWAPMTVPAGEISVRVGRAESSPTGLRCGQWSVVVKTRVPDEVAFLPWGVEVPGWGGLHVVASSAVAELPFPLPRQAMPATAREADATGGYPGIYLARVRGAVVGGRYKLVSGLGTETVVASAMAVVDALGEGGECELVFRDLVLPAATDLASENRLMMVACDADGCLAVQHSCHFDVVPDLCLAPNRSELYWWSGFGKLSGVLAMQELRYDAEVAGSGEPSPALSLWIEGTVGTPGGYMELGVPGVRGAVYRSRRAGSDYRVSGHAARVAASGWTGMELRVYGPDGVMMDSTRVTPALFAAAAPGLRHVAEMRGGSIQMTLVSGEAGETGDDDGVRPAWDEGYVLSVTAGGIGVKDGTRLKAVVLDAGQRDVLGVGMSTGVVSGQAEWRALCVSAAPGSQVFVRIVAITPSWEMRTVLDGELDVADATLTWDYAWRGSRKRNGYLTIHRAVAGPADGGRESGEGVIIPLARVHGLKSSGDKSVMFRTDQWHSAVFAGGAEVYELQQVVASTGVELEAVEVDRNGTQQVVGRVTLDVSAIGFPQSRGGVVMTDDGSNVVGMMAIATEPPMAFVSVSEAVAAAAAALPWRSDADGGAVVVSLGCSNLPSHDSLSASDPFLVVRGVCGVVHVSGMQKNASNAEFSELRIPLAALPVVVEVWDWDSNGDHDLVGRVAWTNQVLGLGGVGPPLRLERAAHGTMRVTRLVFDPEPMGEQSETVTVFVREAGARPSGFVQLSMDGEVWCRTLGSAISVREGVGVTLPAASASTSSVRIEVLDGKDRSRRGAMEVPLGTILARARGEAHRYGLRRDSGQMVGADVWWTDDARDGCMPLDERVCDERWLSSTVLRCTTRGEWANAASVEVWTEDGKALARSFGSNAKWVATLACDAALTVVVGGARNRVTMANLLAGGGVASGGVVQIVSLSEVVAGAATEMSNGCGVCLSATLEGAAVVKGAAALQPVVMRVDGRVVYESAPGAVKMSEMEVVVGKQALDRGVEVCYGEASFDTTLRMMAVASGGSGARFSFGESGASLVMSSCVVMEGEVRGSIMSVAVRRLTMSGMPTEAISVVLRALVNGAEIGRSGELDNNGSSSELAIAHGFEVGDIELVVSLADDEAREVGRAHVGLQAVAAQRRAIEASVVDGTKVGVVTGYVGSGVVVVDEWRWVW
ncbi:uncharacterized protein AMSG_10679 [Thecamonas trahens ATCC 50062]|uniref:C2 domain-containing protein n=1 Tax=Thecamonas trahens ATCC 50062 TaxID=461836 RepID=A0A0L0DS96_THETB|nr:hypothetical protein AMSG_10679 [Thecamonas trahens ATCC 50062]KNC55082.1 hypothetical protein AMSG_10679 [Thecamonas trahens ATCC 50062]|eukprot:XP_013753266.1 hypothetical protein AMSG_10679 [Thecamonas trahens ATCC 50062]